MFQWGALSVAPSLWPSSVFIVPLVFTLLGCSRGASVVPDAPGWCPWASVRSLGTGMLVTLLLVCRWSLVFGISLVTIPLVIGVSLALGLLIGDSS